jgi:hypothetical protein
LALPTGATRSALSVIATVAALSLSPGGLAGCGGGGAPPTQSLVPLFEGARVEQARAHAPELTALAEAAREAALRAERDGHGEEASALATEARLWLAAALATSDQRRFDQEREADLAARERTEQRVVAVNREREQVVEREADARVQALAGAEAQRAFAHAAGYEARRLRRDDADTRALYRETSLALQQRCAAVIAAARSLGAATDEAAALEGRLGTLRQSRRAEDVVADADVLLRDAMGLLGRARAALPADASEPAALVEAATERGLSATRGERGLELRGASLERPRPAALRQLAALLEAHPRGGVQILIIGPVSQRSAGRRRASALRAGLLQAGVAAERLSVVEVVVDAENAGLALGFPAY